MKKVLVTQSSMPSMDEYVEEIKDIWDTHWLTNMGAKHEELTNELREYLGVTDISLFTNGHMALELCLQAIKLPAGGEVITTPFTFASTTHAIVRNNLVPVFCDIREDDYTMDVSKIEALITDKTVAILPVHVYGNICDIDEIERIAKEHNLKVIYDAAHAFGEEYRGIKVGNFGDASMFSFHATKVFNTIEGGAVCFTDGHFGRKLYRLKNFGIRDEDTVDGVGANAKMNEFAAAMGICNLRHIDEEIAKRKAVVEKYRERLSGVEGIKLNVEQEGLVSNYAYFPIVFEDEFGKTRDEVSEALKEQGIFSRKYFYPLTSTYDCYKGQFNPENTPVALDISKRVLTVPLYAGLDLETVNKICDVILDK
ncbi:MAG: DegT/DnrJ/EryC1/StrS family aminotransferase [Eubacterium sp.]|nr:DegT/DnrJ/EryC1/StrS family aminotransferase [Eubacterium sp.]